LHEIATIHASKERNSIGQVENVTTNPQSSINIEFLLNQGSPIDDILADLRDLLKEDEEDEYGTLKPTKHALSWTILLIIGAYVKPHNQWPFGCVATDSEGGIRIEWRSQKGEVRLVVHASDDKKNYIYHQFDGQYAIDVEAHPRKLIWWLNRLV